MSDASAIYAQIDSANNSIGQHKTKIKDLKSKKEKLKKAKGILKDNKSDISDEKRNARKKLMDFNNWKGSNYDTYHGMVESELIEGYSIYSNDLVENIDEINAAIDRIDSKIASENDAIDRLNDQINSLYEELANLEDEEEED
jgi:predicted  nucleic acid-binding Zn-ribbon protein